MTAVSPSQPSSETTPLPWSVAADGKTIMGNGGDNFVVHASATAVCGRSNDDYYGCRSARAEVRLSIKPGDAALLVEAVNSHAALKARIAGLETWQRASLERRDMDSADITTLKARAAELEEALRALRLQALQSSVNDPANEWGIEALHKANAALSHAGPVARDGER